MNHPHRIIAEARVIAFDHLKGEAPQPEDLDALAEAVQQYNTSPDEGARVSSQKEYIIVETGGDWIGVYEIATRELEWEGHPSDMEPLEFLQLCDRLDIDPSRISRTFYDTEQEGERSGRMPSTIPTDVEVTS